MASFLFIGKEQCNCVILLLQSVVLFWRQRKRNEKSAKVACFTQMFPHRDPFIWLHTALGDSPTPRNLDEVASPSLPEFNFLDFELLDFKLGLIQFILETVQL